MNTFVIKNRLSQYIKSYYPYLIFFCLVLTIHLFMGFYSDDVYFSKILSKMSLIEFLKYRYYNWTARVIIDANSVILARQNLIIWKVLDSVFYTIGVYYLIKFVNKINNKKIVIFGILLFFMYPFYEMGSAGWLATTLNYIWPFSLGMISFIPLINEYYGEKTSYLTYIISILASFYAVNHEQSCALIFGFSALYLVNSIMQKKKINKYCLILILISSLSLLIIYTCPGTSIRYHEQLVKLPLFASFGVLEKVYLGIVPTLNILFTDKLIFSIFYILISICALFKTQNKYLKYFLYFNILFFSFLMIYKILFDISMLMDSKNFIAIFGNNNMIIMILGSIKYIITMLYPLYDSMILFNYSGEPNSINGPVILTLSICFYLLISSCLMLLIDFDNKLFPLILFGAGFISRFIMGFSPEVFSSGARTIFYFYITLIMLILMLISKLYHENNIDKKVESILTILFSFFAVLEYVFVLVLTIFIL
ncbi:DUF6056 family protein [uncultured Methanobrevibacter sp.]|uniref:DUF6056 family protein n=1 Tax=uncultured Methanobrevibacter sp. TaxID=253161 RepID=UPI0025FAE772|nr:DUF6056 family protein [uncultured Methanobrevibacter sp.]